MAKSFSLPGMKGGHGAGHEHSLRMFVTDVPADPTGPGVGPGPSILLAIDDSEQAEKAFQFYVNNLHKRGNTLVLFHVAEPPSVASTNMYLSGELWDEMVAQERVKSKAIEDKFASKLKSLNISAKIKTVFCAKPGESIVEQAATEKATLVVMGTRGLGTIRRTVLASVSDFVLHHVHCPVVICRH